MTDDEYKELKEDTMEQIKEVNVRLDKIISRAITTLRDDLSVMPIVSIELNYNITVLI